jgi:hypothetical protein
VANNALLVVFKRRIGELGERVVYLGSEAEEDGLGEELRRGKKGGRTGKRESRLIRRSIIGAGRERWREIMNFDTSGSGGDRAHRMASRIGQTRCGRATKSKRNLAKMC